MASKSKSLHHASFKHQQGIIIGDSFGATKKYLWSTHDMFHKFFFPNLMLPEPRQNSVIELWILFTGCSVINRNSYLDKKRIY